MKKRLSVNPVAAYYWRKACNYPGYLTGAMISLPMTIFVNNYLPPLVLANVIRRLSTNDYVAGDIWASFGSTLIWYLGILILGTILWRVVDFFMWRIEWLVQQEIAEEVFDHMLKQSANFHANHFGGSLVSATNKLLGGYVRTADTTLFQVLPMLYGMLIASAILWRYSPQYVFILLFSSALFLGSAILISKPVRKLATKHSYAESHQTGLLADAITNIMAIKSFARSRYERQRFHGATSKTRRRLEEFSRLHLFQMNVLSTLSRIMSWLALVGAVIAVLQFKANVATAFLIFSYTSTIVDQLFTFSNNSLRNYNRSFGDAADMVGILKESPEVLDPTQPEPVRIVDGTIAFKSVEFTHQGADDALFKKLSVEIKHGEKVGLVGHSGSGKTTFTRLLLRFSDINDGAIEIGGQNIASISQEDLHDNIAYVPQEPLLFHRSLAENIAYGNPKASQAEIEAVAKMAHAHEFITELPEKYATLVGERGVKLSGGQRQRIAIARAMLKQAPVLVLDEATSALDSESEVLIQDALWKLMEGRTSIVIAHRLSTIQRMDRIIVMDNGRIVEQGNHQALLKKKGTYAKLWAHQSGGFLEE